MEKKAHFKFIIPGFKNLDANTQAAIRTGVTNAKLFVFSTTLSDESRVDECEVQWLNESDPTTYYSIRLSSNQEPHANSLIFNDLIPCELTTFNTKLWLCSRSSLTDRTEICDVVVKTMIGDKVNIGQLALNTEIKYLQAYSIQITTEDPNNDDSEFTLLATYDNSIDFNEFIKNGYYADVTYKQGGQISGSQSWSLNYAAIDTPFEIYVKKLCYITAPYSSGGKDGGLIPVNPDQPGDMPVSDISYTYYEKLQKSDWEFNEGTIFISNEAWAQISSSSDSIIIVYKPKDGSAVHEVTGKLSFRQSSVEFDSTRIYAKSITIYNASIPTTVWSDDSVNDSSTYNNTFRNLRKNRGIVSFINGNPVTILGIKSYNKDKAVYVSGDSVTDESLSKLDLVNQGGDHDGGEDGIVTAIVIDDAQEDVLINLYAKRDSSGYTKPQSEVINTSTAYESYIYNLYTSPTTQDETTLFTPDPNSNYKMMVCKGVTNLKYGILEPVGPSTYRVRDKVEDMPSTMNHNTPTILYEMQPDGRLWLGHNSKYSDQRYTNVNITYRITQNS